MPRYEIRDEESGEALGIVVGDIGLYWDVGDGAAKSFQMVRLEDGAPTR